MRRHRVSCGRMWRRRLGCPREKNFQGGDRGVSQGGLWISQGSEADDFLSVPVTHYCSRGEAPALWSLHRNPSFTGFNFCVCWAHLPFVVTRVQHSVVCFPSVSSRGQPPGQLPFLLLDSVTYYLVALHTLDFLPLNSSR